MRVALIAAAVVLALVLWAHATARPPAPQCPPPAYAVWVAHGPDNPAWHGWMCAASLTATVGSGG